VTRIGITGGIGSGKSTVSRYWSSCFDVPLLDLDQICRDLLVQGEPGWQAMAKRFGNRFFRDDGSLDRTSLRAALFANSGFRQQVDDILHPLARLSMHERISTVAARVVLVEIPLLCEAGWHQDVDRIVLVYAGAATRIHRIAARDAITTHEAEQALAAQWSLEKKISWADHVVDNSGVWPATCLEIRHLGTLYS